MSIPEGHDPRKIREIADRLLAYFSQANLPQVEEVRLHVGRQLDRITSAKVRHDIGQLQFPLSTMLYSNAHQGFIKQFMQEVVWRIYAALAASTVDLLPYDTLAFENGEGLRDLIDSSLHGGFKSFSDSSGFPVQRTANISLLGSASHRFSLDFPFFLLYGSLYQCRANASKHGKANTLNVRIQRQDNSICITVTDDGVGIMQDTLDTVFSGDIANIFFEGKSGGGSTGLGLANLPSVWERYGGTVTAKLGEPTIQTKSENNLTHIYTPEGVKIPVGMKTEGLRHTKYEILDATPDESIPWLDRGSIPSRELHITPPNFLDLRELIEPNMIRATNNHCRTIRYTLLTGEDELMLNHIPYTMGSELVQRGITTLERLDAYCREHGQVVEETYVDLRKCIKPGYTFVDPEPIQYTSYPIIFEFTVPITPHTPQ